MQKNIQIILIVIIDQTKIVFVSESNDAVWEIKRNKQVFIYKKTRNKPLIMSHQVILKIKFFPFQSLYKRYTAISLNMKNVF